MNLNLRTASSASPGRSWAQPSESRHEHIGIDADARGVLVGATGASESRHEHIGIDAPLIFFTSFETALGISPREHVGIDHAEDSVTTRGAALIPVAWRPALNAVNAMRRGVEALPTTLPGATP